MKSAFLAAVAILATAMDASAADRRVTVSHSQSVLTGRGNSLSITRPTAPAPARSPVYNPGARAIDMRPFLQPPAYMKQFTAPAPFRRR